MTTVKQGFDKIVRDRIPEIIRSEGRAVRTRTLTRDEAVIYLKKKLREEVEEFLSDDSLPELADIVEVVRALAVELGSSPRGVELMRREKQVKSGGFARRVLLVEAELPVAHPSNVFREAHQDKTTDVPLVSS